MNASAHTVESVTSVSVHCLILQPVVDSVTDFTWLIGGPQGSGVESAAVIFSQICAKAGYFVFGKREFHSNIKGEHSYFAVRLSDKMIRSSSSGVSLMVSYDAETIFRHYSTITKGGAIIYDSDLNHIKAADVSTLDKYYFKRMCADLNNDNPTVEDVLRKVADNDVVTYPVSFKELLADMAESHNNPRLRVMKRMYNVMGVSLAAGLIQLPKELLIDAVRGIFAKKRVIADLNADAATHSYNVASNTMTSTPFTLHEIEKTPNLMLVQGHLGTSLGKLAAGCRFQSYYPITPASDESVYLEANGTLPNDTGQSDAVVVVQTEDEISAIGMMIGAALTGVRSSTSTSGPGFSLMAEALGWAGINEVPVVLTLYQRSGPSTGLPTRHGQDDLLFAVFAGHGEFPRIVYASGDIEESFYDTCSCFNYSDVYQLPVIHMMDKFLSSTTMTCPAFDPSQVTIDRGKLLDGVEGEYKRFQLGGDGISPRSYLGLKDGIFWNTGDESDEVGHITEDPVVRQMMMDKRLGRLDLILQQVPDIEQAVSHATGEYTIISWGSTKGPILDALEMLQQEGITVGFVQIKMLHPFPTECVQRLLDGARVIIDVESNQTAQMGKLFAQNLNIPINHYILKYTGRAMTCEEIRDSLLDIIHGTSPKRRILMHGA